MIYHLMNVRDLVASNILLKHLLLVSNIVFRVDFNNTQVAKAKKNILQNPKLPDVTSSTFFQVRTFLIIYSI